MSKALVEVGTGGANEQGRQPAMRSAAHRSHAAMGARFERRTAWEVPGAYGREGAEVDTLHSTLGFADISARGKVHLSGAVDPLIMRLTGGTLAPQRTGPTGSSGLVARLARDWAIALVPPSGEGAVISELMREATDEAMATDVTSGMSGFLVAGPRLDEFFARSVTLDAAELRAGRCAAATWARIPAVLVMRDLAAPAVELYVGSDHGRYAWETIGDLCSPLRGSPVGWRALETWGWK